MNAETKKQMDERLIEGTMSPDEYLAGIRAHRDQAAASDAGATARPIFTSAKRTRPSMKPWQWGVLIPVVLIFSSLFAERPPLTPSQLAQAGGGKNPPSDARPKTLRDYYQNPQNNYANPEDVAKLAWAMTPEGQQALAQMQEAARQQYQAQQGQRRQQDPQKMLEYAQRFQNMGVPHWARPPAGQQQAAPSNIQPSPTGGPCSYTCVSCGLIQTYSAQQGILPRCPRDGGLMSLRR
jgi:hypothetical protein